jgi:hypothetical protein
MSSACAVCCVLLEFTNSLNTFVDHRQAVVSNQLLHYDQILSYESLMSFLVKRMLLICYTLRVFAATYQ